MMFEIRSEAIEEADDATKWYRAVSVELATRFADAVHRSLERIETHGASMARLEDYRGRRVVRRDLVDGFPYMVVFHCTAGKTTVVAIAHTSRKPMYWKERLK